jgi:hypothetical protein
MPGPLHRPGDRRVPRFHPGLSQQPRTTGRGRRDLQLRQQPPEGITQRRRMRIPVSIDPTTKPASSASLTAPPPPMRSFKGGTGLEGNSCGNPVMGHGHPAGQAPDQANEGGQAGAGSTRDMSDQRHATRRSGTQRVTRRRQAPTWQDPPQNTADTCEAILTGTLDACCPVGGSGARLHRECHPLPSDATARSAPRHRAGSRRSCTWPLSY